MSPPLDLVLSAKDIKEKRLVPNVHDGISYDQFMQHLGDLMRIKDIDQFGLTYYNWSVMAELVVTTDVEWLYAVRRRFTQSDYSRDKGEPVSAKLFRREPQNDDKTYTAEECNTLTARFGALQATNANLASELAKSQDAQAAQSVELATLKDAHAAQAVQLEKLTTANLVQSKALAAALVQAGAGQPVESEQAEPSGSRPRKSARRGAA